MWDKFIHALDEFEALLKENEGEEIHDFDAQRICESVRVSFVAMVDCFAWHEETLHSHNEAIDRYIALMESSYELLLSSKAKDVSWYRQSFQPKIAMARKIKARRPASEVFSFD